MTEAGAEQTQQMQNVIKPNKIHSIDVFKTLCQGSCFFASWLLAIHFRTTDCGRSSRLSQAPQSAWQLLSLHA